MSKNQDLQIFELKLNKHGLIFSHLEVVVCGGKTQLQLGENFNQ